MERLAHLTDEERRILEGLCSRTIEVPDGMDIVRQGDKPKDSNLLLQGLVCRYVHMSDGGRQIQSFHTPGDVIDAHSFLLDEMDHNIKTLTRCTLAIIPHAALVSLTETHPRIARAIWKDTLADGAIFRQWIANVGRRNAYRRVAHLICEVFIKLDAVGLAEGHTIDWPMTQAELADATGLSIVHVNRTLQDLRRANLITLERGRLTIPRWERLKEASAFDPAYLQLGAGTDGPRPLH
jgi:CRP-like cAMP-binding protein